MKINKLYISAFGKLKDFSLNLKDGFQIIFGENEVGKTTVCEFIKAMFYGTGKRSAGQSMSTREKYAPWDGSPAGGRIYFEHSGREFFIERQFRKSDSTDKVTITDTVTGKSEVCPSDIGKTLFGISMNAFERSVFIGNMPAVTNDSDAASEINQKLSSSALSENGVSYAKVLKRLDDAKYKLISKSGKTGSRAADIEARDELLTRLTESDRAAKEKQEIQKALKAADKRLEKIESECEAASAVLEKTKDIENAGKLKEYIALKKELDELTRQLTLSDGTVADEMFIKKLDFGFSKLDNIRERKKAHEAELEALKNAAKAREGLTTEQIKEKIEEAKTEIEDLKIKAEQKSAAITATEKEIDKLNTKNDLQKDAKRAVNPILLTLGISVIILGIVLCFLLKSAVSGTIAGVSGVFITILAFILRPVNRTRAEAAQRELNQKSLTLGTQKSQLMMLKSESKNLEAKIQNLSASLSLGVSEQQKIRDIGIKISNDEQTLISEQKKLLAFFGLPDSTDAVKLKKLTDLLSEKAEKQKQIKLNLAYLSRDLGDISYETAEQRLAKAGDISDIDLDDQKMTANKLISEKTEIIAKKARLETELKTAFRNLSDPEDLRREIALYEEKIKAKQEYFDALSIAYDVLNESLAAARKSFSSILESNTLDIFRKITGGAYGFLTVSDSFDISAEKSDIFGSHELEYLSRGTKDQAYLSLRLAISRLITEKEPLPLILDDSLSQYDDKRFSSAFEFLKGYGENSQICLFTCHNFVCDEARKEEIPVIRI
ncbi:MAG: AAA family ATPase [Clostridia bacterium]|nr:AAA family ATPase [Clostridia bacterium]